MTYNGDSTYSYNYTLNTTGTVSVTVILRNPGRVWYEWYTNNLLTAPSFTTYETTHINNDWSTGTICCSRSTFVSAIIETYLRPNISGTYTFHFAHNSGSAIWIEGTNYINRWGQVIGITETFTVTLTKDTNYYVRIEYQESTGFAYIIRK